MSKDKNVQGVPKISGALAPSRWGWGEMDR